MDPAIVLGTCMLICSIHMHADELERPFYLPGVLMLSSLQAEGGYVPSDLKIKFEIVKRLIAVKI